MHLPDLQTTDKPDSAMTLNELRYTLTKRYHVEFINKKTAIVDRSCMTWKPKLMAERKHGASLQNNYDVIRNSY